MDYPQVPQVPELLSINVLHQSFLNGVDSPLHLTRRCLERIKTLDKTTHAWVLADPERSLKAAESSAQRFLEQKPRSPVDGIPFGVKDIIDVAHWPTACGSSFYQVTPKSTASLVARLEDAGAIPIGKTVTTPFACFDPASTENPRVPGHTPGGSSSGSAAAVAGGHVPFALGSQTGGSVIRPAAYCGTCGFKPTFALFDTKGVFPVSGALDTLGWFSQSPSDLLSIYDALLPELAPSSEKVPTDPHRFVVWQPLMEALDNVASRKAYESTFKRLSDSGHEIVFRDLPLNWDECLHHHRTLMVHDLAIAHRDLWPHHQAEYPPGLAELVREGQTRSATERQKANDFQKQVVAQMNDSLGISDIGLSPASAGPAPRGLASTGSPIMNSIWTLLGCPAVTLPLPGTARLPLGLQLTASQGDDRRLLRVADDLATELTLDSRNDRGV